MYHRYLRNEQGEYRRQTVPDPPRSTPPPQRQNISPVSGQDASHGREIYGAAHGSAQADGQSGRNVAQNAASPEPKPDLRQQREAADHAPAPDYGIPFLGKLFPGMDQGDLLLLLIMLLLLSEGNEDANAMAMTLAIYLFLQ